jgi:hypothetical protein
MRLLEQGTVVLVQKAGNFLTSYVIIYGRWLVGIAGSNPAGGHGCLSIVSVVCCQVEVSATGRFLVQRSPTDCGPMQFLR